MTKKFSKRNTRKITRSGNSLNVSLPVEFLAKLGWREKQKVKLSRVYGGILIKDWKK
ncbi:MAG: AbrB/MazE/SpoVT family DNA-binding domain-containing protein [bacterium]|nr:AbrB/MazE/SpoVT family DNA-binding domain-containing protein [bacterium]